MGYSGLQMNIARALLATGSLLLAAAALAPSAAADDFVTVTLFDHTASACAIAVKGSCEPYNGHLVRVTVDGQEHVVPDPCYTTACF